MTKAELITQLVSTGRAGDLLLMLEGESPYTNKNSEGAPADRLLGRLWTAALYHLRFVTECGDTDKTVMKDGKWLSPFPEEFSAWLNAGAPGISISDLERYVKENPL